MTRLPRIGKGQRRMGELPTSAVIYSTHRHRRLGQAMAGSPRADAVRPRPPREVLENAVEERGGYLFETGDAFRAAFATARGPVEAAPPPGRTKGWRRS